MGLSPMDIRLVDVFYTLSHRKKFIDNNTTAFEMYLL